MADDGRDDIALNDEDTAPPYQRAAQDLPDISSVLPIMLLRTREAMMAHIRPVLRAHGVTEQQWRVLRACDVAIPPNATSIAKDVALLAPSLSRILRRLEARTLLAGIASGRGARRARYVLTPRGRKLVRAMAPAIKHAYARMGERLGQAELAALESLLERSERRLTTPD